MKLQPVWEPHCFSSAPVKGHLSITSLCSLSHLRAGSAKASCIILDPDLIIKCSSHWVGSRQIKRCVKPISLCCISNGRHWLLRLRWVSQWTLSTDIPLFYFLHLAVNTKQRRLWIFWIACNIFLYQSTDSFDSTGEKKAGRPELLVTVDLLAEWISSDESFR